MAPDPCRYHLTTILGDRKPQFTSTSWTVASTRRKDPSREPPHHVQKDLSFARLGEPDPEPCSRERDRLRFGWLPRTIESTADVQTAVLAVTGGEAVALGVLTRARTAGAAPSRSRESAFGVDDESLMIWQMISSHRTSRGA